MLAQRENFCRLEDIPARYELCFGFPCEPQRFTNLSLMELAAQQKSVLFFDAQTSVLKTRLSSLATPATVRAEVEANTRLWMGDETPLLLVIQGLHWVVGQFHHTGGLLQEELPQRFHSTLGVEINFAELALAPFRPPLEAPCTMTQLLGLIPDVLMVTPDNRVLQAAPLNIHSVGQRLYGLKDVPESVEPPDMNKIKAIGDVMKSQQQSKKVPPWKKKLSFFQNSESVIGVASRYKHDYKCIQFDKATHQLVGVFPHVGAFTYTECSEWLERLDGGGLEKHSRGYGLMGVLRFCLGPYLAVISKRQQVARLLQRYPVFVVQSVALVPIFHLTGLPPQKTREELRFRTEFLSFISSRDFYFAYNYDLGQSLQINAALSAPVVDCEHDSKFVWNHHHNRMWCGLTAGHDVETYSTVQVINGSMAARSLILDSRKLEIALIARRSRVFAGTRYLKRGVDSGGNVANEVEVEQVVHDWTKSEVYSFVQVRGSIPLMWRQEPSRLKPKPPIECRSQTDAGHNSCKLHFSSLISRYGSPVMVMNLVRSPSQDEFPRDGTQRRHTGEIHIGQRFRRVVSDLNRTLPDPVKLEYTECDVKLLHGKSKAAMFLVLSRLGEQCVRRHWFYHASDGALGAPYTIQVGVCRTNCIDCLDRTNVAQFVMGRVMLAYQLAAMGVLSDPRTMLVQLPFTKGNPLVGVNSRTLQSILYPVPVPTFRVPNVYDPVLNETESTDSSHEVVDSPVMGTSWVAGRIYEMIFGGDDENPSTSRLPNEVWKSVASCSEDAEPEAKLLGVVADLYMCMGDLLALQYGGSVAHKHLQLDSSSMQKKGKELITSITRHCVNNFVDADRQSVMNVSIGVQSAMNRMLQSSNAIEVDRWLHHCLSRNAPTLQRDWGSRALHKYALLYGLALVNKHETGAAFSPATVVGQLAQAVKGLTEVCSCCQGYRKSLFLKTNIIELAKLREGRMLIPHTQGTRHASLTSDSSSGSTSEAVKPPPLEYTSFRSLQSAAFAVRVSLDVSATSALGAMRRSGTRGASRSATDDALTRMQRQHRSGTDGSEGATSRRHLVTAPKRAASLDFVWFPGPERTQLHVAAAVPSLYTDESRITWRSVFLRMLGTVHPAPLKPVTHWVSHARCGSWRGRPKIHVCKSSGRIVRPGVRWLAVADVHITPLQPPLIRRTTQEPPTFSNVTLRRSGLVPISSTSRPYRSLYATKGKYLQDA